MALSLLFLLFLHSACSLPQTEPPLLRDLPFISVWNAPTDKCPLTLDMAYFQAISSPKAAPGHFLTLFYEKNLGMYPKYDPIGQKTHHGGSPLNGSLAEHLAKAGIDIDNYISQDSSPGLAVIDWEGWRPLWEQNWTSKRVYKNLSLAYVLDTEPVLSDRGILDEAKRQFENAARRFMEETLNLGKQMRPNKRWGFYLFPNCFNNDWNRNNYTGKCSEKTRKQNDEMGWLWECSTALFPSVYLDIKLRNSPRAALLVRNRVQEALRVAARTQRSHNVPVFVYARPLYREQSQVFLSQTDLVHTVGESAALGAAGIVMWGASLDYNNKASCKSLSSYLSSTLGPYMANVTTAALLCSQLLCGGKGRCVRKNYDSAHYLHLSPAHFSLLRRNRKYIAEGLPSRSELTQWAQHFTCHCYYEQDCSPRMVLPKTIQKIWI